MNRYEIEEAVEQAKQLVSTVRGIQGLMGICEVSLNQTKYVDGLEERKQKLMDEIATIEKEKETKLQSLSLSYGHLESEHKQRIDSLLKQEKVMKEKINELNVEYGDKKKELEEQHRKLENEFQEWMKDCQQKQVIANTTLTTITNQINAIKEQLR